MWLTKKFKTENLKNQFIEKNKNDYQITEIFINNGYCVEYKKLKKITF